MTAVTLSNGTISEVFDIIFYNKDGIVKNLWDMKIFGYGSV